MRINGWVDIESGERAEQPDSIPDLLLPGDTRTTPARRADLLLDMVDGAVGSTILIVHVSAETLLEDKPGITETSNGTFLTGDEIRRISCDANLTRVVFGPDSQPLDVGRTKRLVTPALRIASHGPRPALCLPRLRPARQLVRCPPSHPLVKRWSHQPRQSDPPLPASPHPGPRRRLADRRNPRPSQLLPARRKPTRRRTATQTRPDPIPRPPAKTPTPRRHQSRHPTNPGNPLPPRPIDLSPGVSAPHRPHGQSRCSRSRWRWSPSMPR